MEKLELIGLGMATLDILLLAGDVTAWHMGMPLDALAIDGGGMACNAMVAAQKLGTISSFIGSYGSDRLGQIKLQTLQESGVDSSQIIQRDAPDDQVVLVHVNPAIGERTFYPLAAPWRKPILPQELDRDYLIQAELLLVDGFHPAAAYQAAQWMHAAGKRVMLDANVHHEQPSAELIRLIRETDYLVCSAGFLQALAETENLAEAAVKALDLGSRVVVQTEGARGCDTFTRDQQFHTPAFPVEVVDTTGAGDVFHGAFLVGLLNGWDLARIVRFSSAAAALACRKLGRAGFPTLPEVWGLMKD